MSWEEDFRRNIERTRQRIMEIAPDMLDLNAHRSSPDQPSFPIHASELGWKRPSSPCRPAIGPAGRASLLTQVIDAAPAPISMLSCTGGVDTMTYEGKVESSTVIGKLYFPAPTPSANAGLIVLCHGAFNPPDRHQGYEYVFESLAKCMAAHGIVVASIRPEPSEFGTIGAADKAVRLHVDYLLGGTDKIAFLKLSGKPFAVGGHSAGAHGAVIAAEMLSQLGRVPAAVVALAPTTAQASTPVSGIGKSLLVMQGSHDGDQPIGAGSIQILERMKTTEKFFVWIHGANHAQFLNGSQPVTNIEDVTKIDGKTLSRTETQHVIVSNYVTMFLLWKLAEKGEKEFGGVFHGQTIKWIHDDPEVQSQLNFSRIYTRYAPPLPMYFGNDGADWSAQHFLNPIMASPLHLQHWTCFHQTTRGGLLTWDKSVHPAPSIMVSCTPGLGEIFAQASAMEFDCALVAKSSFNFPQEWPMHVMLSLQAGVKRSSVVVARVPHSIDIATNYAGVNLSRSIPATVRIPIDTFDVDPAFMSGLTNVRIDFSRTRPRGQVLFTNPRVVLAG